MAIRYLSASSDTWFAVISGTNYGNGRGARLYSGESTDAGANWQNRFGITFQDNVSIGTENITEVLLRWKGGSGGCFTQGSNPNCYIERVSSLTTRIEENSYSANCGVDSGGSAAEEGDGPATTATNRVQWNPASVAAGTTYEIDITTLFLDWWAVRSFVPDVASGDARAAFSIMVKAVNEASASQRFNIRSSEYDGSAINAGGNGPDIKITYNTNATPEIPSVNLSPSGRQSGASTITYSFDFDDPDGEQCHQCYIQVSTDATFASVTNWDSGWVSPTTAASGRATKTHGGAAFTRGTQYYWRVKVRDDDLAASGYSSATAFDINEYATATSRSPG